MDQENLKREKKHQHVLFKDIKTNTVFDLYYTFKFSNILEIKNKMY
jgi:hypothetical protein